MNASANPQLAEHQRQQNQYLEALHDITLGLLENLDLERLLEAIMTHAVAQGNTAHGFIDIYDPNVGATQVRVAHGNFRPHLGDWIKPGEGFSGRVFAEGQTRFLEDYQTFSGRLQGYEWLRSMVCVPLRIGSAVIGVIGLGYDQVTEIQLDHLDFLTQFGHLASLVLKNAQQYADSQREIAERKQIESEMTKLKDNLEETVNERSMELLEANAKLHFEIMDRLRIEEALRTSEERYRLLIENAPMGILSTTRAGSVLSINSAAIKTLIDPKMLDQDEVNLFEIPFLVEAGLAEAMRQCLRTEAPVVTELLFRKASGEESYQRIHITPILASSETVAGLQIILEDITDRKLAEVTLQVAYDRLKELHHLKDEFIASISHELRTPITNLKLYHHLMERKPEQTVDYLAKLNEQTMRLEHVVEGILTLSEVKDELKRIRLAPFDIHALMMVLMSDYTPRAAARDLSLHFEANLDDQRQAIGDGALLGRVLSILLDNSLSYTPTGGQVQVCLICEIRDDKRWIGVRVENNGPQIPDEEVPRIFDRFYRGQAALNSKTPGAGLGLATAKEIIEAMQGRIEITNEGTITAFYVWLPAYSI